MTSKVVTVSIERDGSMCVIPVPFDPLATFGKSRPPVKVTVNGYTFRSTIFNMGDRTFVPFRKSNREAAGLEGGERVKVRFALDAEKRTVEPPADLVKALKKRAPVWRCWTELSFTAQREGVESVLGAKQPETRLRRIAKVVDLVEEKVASRKT